MTGLTAQLLLRAYAAGIFPMAESAESEELYWFDPEQPGYAAITAAGGTVTLVPLPFKAEGKAGRPAVKGNQFVNR